MSTGRQPSYKTLGNRDQEYEDILLNMMTKVNVATEKNADVIKKAIFDIKEAANAYQTANRALSDYLIKKKKIAEASEVRNSRIEIINTDVKEVVHSLNLLLKSMGQDAASSIGQPSVIVTPSVAKAKSVKNKTAEPIDNEKSPSNSDEEDSSSGSTETEFLSQELDTDGEPEMVSVKSKLINKVVNSVSSEVVDDIEHLDPVSRRQLKLDLLKGSGDLFNGDPEHFWSWQQQISRRLLEAEVGALDSLYVLKANTSGRPNRIVLNGLSAGAHDPKKTLAQVWADLKKRFGSNILVSEALTRKLDDSPSIRNSSDVRNLENLLDICKLISANQGFCPELSVFDLKDGMKRVWLKLPHDYQVKWRKQWVKHEDRTGSNPKFQQFINFLTSYVNEVSVTGFLESTKISSSKNSGHQAKALHTRSSKFCLYHNASDHDIHDCSELKQMSYEEVKEFAKDNRLCYGCLGPHRYANCPKDMSCNKCNGHHCTLVHRERKVFHGSQKQYSSSKNSTKESHKPPKQSPDSSSPAPANSEDKPDKQVKAHCVSVCGNSKKKIVCSKTLLVDVSHQNSDKILQCLCILDEQSDTSFCDPKFVEFFGLTPPPPHQPYKLKSMGEINTVNDSCVLDGLQVKGARMDTWYNIDNVFTYNNIPDAREEVATPEMVAKHSHIRHLSRHFDSKDRDFDVMLFVGADCGELMHCQTFGSHFPYVHKTPIGFSVVGPVCEQEGGEIKICKALRTSVSSCNVHLCATNTFDMLQKHDIFQERPDDDLLGLSQNDQHFLNIVSSGITQNEKGNLQIPLPLKPDAVFPKNEHIVKKRTLNTLQRLKRDESKTIECCKVMQKYLDADHVEQVPKEEINVSSPSYYIPVFPVQHPRKKKIRIVFDSSAPHGGRCLNDNLFKGPDNGNRIVGVLTRFRHGSIGVSADIEQMFHAFRVPPEHRDLQRFFWWEANDPRKSIVPHRAKVHVFGNCSSPSVATFGLQHTATTAKAKECPAASELIKQNFYVDDALAAMDTVEEAVETLENVREILLQFNIRLHKIVSNSPAVLNAFPKSEIADNIDIVELNLSPPQKTLGVAWQMSTDNFLLKSDLPERRETRRGLLSMTNSLYDPLGFISPVILGGRLLQRQVISARALETTGQGWDDPLPPTFSALWRAWTASLSCAVSEVIIPRSFSPPEFGSVVRRELHTFCDASQEAIGIVMYLRIIDEVDNVHVSFVFANSKVAPRTATTIPRLELNAAVMAAQSTYYMTGEMGHKIDAKFLYSDSCVALGYIRNTERAFSKYVTTRVALITKTSDKSQWSYVATHLNPADLASRPQTPQSLANSNWFVGPDFLWQKEPSHCVPDVGDADQLPEVMKEAKILHSRQEASDGFSKSVCSATNDWNRAKKIMASVVDSCNAFLKLIKKAPLENSENLLAKSATLLIISAQKDSHPSAYSTLNKKLALPESEKLSGLSPFIDNDGVIRVGGRLKRSRMPFNSKHPILLPAKHLLTQMILRHHHERTHHQGRHITAGALQQAGFHIHAGGPMIRNFINRCVSCRKLRAPLLTQKMSDLPADRIEKCPPFSNTGIDAFGPYLVHDGANTRRNTANKKVWGLLLTCLTTRAVHIEPLSSMDSSTFQLALRRFLAIRGQCKLLRSDSGTNFVGASNEINRMADSTDVKRVISDAGIKWEFITPGASHAGGAWERKVGAVKQVLNVAISQLNKRHLSRCELYTLFQESAAIVNNTPLYQISSDPNDPVVISPAMLLTLKDSPNPPPSESFSESDLLQYGRKRWRRVQHLTDVFWKQWRSHYLRCLQWRNKWTTAQRNVKVNDIVLLRDHSPRNCWPTGRVSHVETSSDGLVRTVTLDLPPTSGGKPRSLRRCIQDIVLLIPQVD